MGGVDSRVSYVLKILYVKMKESGPLGACAGYTPPRPSNEQGPFGPLDPSMNSSLK